jgi:hypothetical protein
VRRLDEPLSSLDAIAEFLRLQREGRGLDHLRAHLPADATPDAARRLFRKLRGIGRRPSAANGEIEDP